MRGTPAGCVLLQGALKSASARGCGSPPAPVRARPGQHVDISMGSPFSTAVGGAPAAGTWFLQGNSGTAMDQALHHYAAMVSDPKPQRHHVAEQQQVALRTHQDARLHGGAEGNDLVGIERA